SDKLDLAVFQRLVSKESRIVARAWQISKPPLPARCRIFKRCVSTLRKALYRASSCVGNRPAGNANRVAALVLIFSRTACTPQSECKMRLRQGCRSDALFIDLPGMTNSYTSL